MKKLLVKILKHKKILFIIVAVFFITVSWGVVSVMAAGNRTIKAIDQGVGTAVATVLSWIAYVFLYIIGLIITLIIQVLVNVAQFNNIINVDAVKQGWVIIRDICNMFFILILLVIAFSTILRIESYSVKKTLPKLLIMAVLINFSKTIFGLIIDFSQVVMLTFVNGFAQTSTSNFVTIFETNKIASLWTGSGADANSWAVAGAIIAGLIAAIITLIVIGVLLAVLIVRVVMLWIYTIMSPLVFLGFAFPPLQKYTGKIWEDFIKQVIVGPVLAFFIWLALATAATSSATMTTNGNAVVETSFCAGLNAFFCDTTFQQFIITIALLMGGLMVAQQMGGAAGSIAGKGLTMAKGTIASVGAGGLMATGWAQRKFAGSKYGFETRPGKIIEGIKESFKSTEKKDDLKAMKRGSEIMSKGGIRGILGGVGAGKAWADRFVSLKGLGNIAHDVRYNDKSRAKLLKKKEDREAIIKGGMVENENEIERLRTGTQTSADKYEKKRQVFNLAEETVALKNDLAKESNPYKQEELRKEIDTNKAKQKELTESLLLPIDESKNEKIKEHEDKVKNATVQDTELRAIKEQMKTARKPQSFEGIAAYNALVNEEEAKIKNVTSSDELRALYQDAKADKDEFRMAAIGRRLAQDGNINDLLNEEGYDASGVGLHKYVSEELVGKGYMSEHQGLQFQSDIGERAERVGQWELARTTGVDEFGNLKSLIKQLENTNGTLAEHFDDTAHAIAAATEIYKMDPQGMVKLGRLSYGGEDKDGNYKIASLGKVLVKGMQQAFLDNDKRISISMATNLSKPEVAAELEKIGANTRVMAAIKTRGIVKEGANAPGDVLARIKKIENVTKTT